MYQVNVLLFDHTGRHEEAAYGIMVPQLDGVTRSPPVLLSESFSTFTGSGWSQMTPRTQTALALMWVESAAGLFMSIVVLARFIAILPVPHSRTKGEKDIV